MSRPLSIYSERRLGYLILGDALRLRRLLLLVLLALAILIAPPAFARESVRCANGRSSVAAMWLSIAHPGLGEYHLEGGGDWSHMPERKFWFGFIPLYGWPGYLQIESALDRPRGGRNDHDPMSTTARPSLITNLSRGSRVSNT